MQKLNLTDLMKILMDLLIKTQLLTSKTARLTHKSLINRMLLSTLRADLQSSLDIQEILIMFQSSILKEAQTLLRQALENISINKKLQSQLILEMDILTTVWSMIQIRHCRQNLQQAHMYTHSISKEIITSQ